MTERDLHPDEIQVWWALMDNIEPQIERFRLLLDEAELARADRLRVDAARRRFIGARAMLRSILGRAVGVKAEDVAFAFGPYGKPRLATGGPFFNATDSGDVVVVALASDEIGVDVEVVRRLTRAGRLARRVCTDRELEALEEMTEADRDAAMLRLWTCKEAGLKAIGTGLRGGMRNVEVDLKPDRAWELRRLCGEIDGWALLPVDLQPDLTCTIVIRGGGRRVVSQRWPLSMTGTADVC